MYDTATGFAEDVVTPSGTVAGIFSSEYAETETEEGVPMAGAVPELRTRDADAVAYGGWVIVRGVPYDVIAPAPDGYGETVHRLRVQTRAADVQGHDAGGGFWPDQFWWGSITFPPVKKATACASFPAPILPGATVAGALLGVEVSAENGTFDPAGTRVGIEQNVASTVPAVGNLPSSFVLGTLADFATVNGPGVYSLDIGALVAEWVALPGWASTSRLNVTLEYVTDSPGAWLETVPAPALLDLTYT